jgi:molybdopterin synthase catalytic subunit
MKIQVLYFAQARERAGRSTETLDLAEGDRLEAALAAIRRAHPELDPLWQHLAVAVDGELAPADATLRSGAEIALLPPVSGGSR